MRRISFADDEYYHVYNRGVEKRDIFCDEKDFQRFLQSLEEFNVLDATGGIYANTLQKAKTPLPRGSASRSEKLVEIVAYCLNPNHFHLIVKQVSEKGIEKFMHRLGTGYTMYFNKKYQRSGVLFQGKFKAIHVDTNEYLLRLSVYVNRNDKVHRLRGLASKSSWLFYTSNVQSSPVNPEVVLTQFADIQEYEKFAEEVLRDILARRILTEDF